MRAKRFPFTQKQLRTRLRYDAETGKFIWIDSNRIAGTLTGAGYVHIKIDGNKYLAHRLAWFYVYGEQPSIVDHEDTIKNHNWLDNLRPATKNQNQYNTALGIHNTSGFKGVYKAGDRWRAEITSQGVKQRLGYFDSADEAGAAYIKAAKKLHLNFARWGDIKASRRRPMMPPMQKRLPSRIQAQIRHG